MSTSTLNASAKPFYTKALSQDKHLKDMEEIPVKIKEFMDAFAFRPAWAYTDDDNLDDIVAAYWASIGKK